MSPRNRVLTAVVALAVALSAPALADAPNVLANGSFDLSSAGWERFGAAGDAAWVPTDAGGYPRSGSLRLSSAADTLAVEAMSPCVPLVPGQTYAVSGRAWVDPVVNGAQDFTGVGLQVYSEPSCTGAEGLWGLVGISRVTQIGRWQSIGGTFPAAEGMRSARVRISLVHPPENPGPLDAYFDDFYVRAHSCAADPTTLCLGGGRFRVTVVWGTGTDGGPGWAVPSTDDAGAFWFFSPENIEVTVKVLDGCSLNQRFWVFAAGLTDVGVLLLVQDMETGEFWQSTSARGQPFSTVTDTDAFATCP